MKTEQMVGGFDLEIWANRMDENKLNMDMALWERRYHEGEAMGFDGWSYADNYYDNYQSKLERYRRQLRSECYNV